MNLHGKIMNLQCGELAFGGLGRNYINAHKLGHRDARHAAAELALKADRCIDALRAVVEQQRTMGFDGSPSDELMDEARDALKVFGEA